MGKHKKMDKNFASFIKFGEKKYMEKLYFDGEIFCKNLNYFIQLDEESLRGDKYDGSAYIKQAKDLKIKHKGEIIATATNGQLFGRDPNNTGNIYCLYGISSDHINFDKKINQKLNVDIQSVEFAETAVLNYQPLEFINRILDEIVKNGFDCEFSPIIYLDENVYEGELNHFNKRKKYESQSEVRIWIPNKINQDLKFNIGSIEDISVLYPKEMMLKLECEPE